ncbi:2'-5' RNA ligase [Sphingomonas vulcanisoli]|uniref:RNA 2',3'-cyclic phosphodiesterase n=1 Tax=Sphingomonas vulcanisoli TaxID=1658060 RepID=A0ABX0TR20_9SPHN|nr:RNA 2',3'-cyclic phosphodiesterase [Sphingomonas vulcanisoli]NIJ07974.1 2'-5' RNA ligase [Sphingomonas vulcanisoli]
MHRLFVALRPPGEVRERLRAIMGGVPGARWQSDDQLHLTLRFIGEVDDHVAEEIALALDRVRHAPVTIALSGVGSFGSRGRPHSLWARALPSPGLGDLHTAVEGALRRCSIAPDPRAFTPHITLARLARTAGPIDRWLAESAGLAIQPFTIESFELYESELGREGSIYHVAARYQLR